MAAVTVCIALDDQGHISVGTEPPDEGDQSPMLAGGQTDLAQPNDESSEQSDFQPAKSIDDALSIARDLLRNAAQVGGAVVGGEPGGAGAQDAANAAFASRRGGQMGGM